MQNRRRALAAFGVAGLMVMSAAACGTDTDSKSEPSAANTSAAQTPTQPASDIPECAGVSQADCDAWQKVQFRPLPSFLTLPDASTLAPAGELGGYPEGQGPRPAWYTDLKITPQQVATIRSKNLKAAFLNWDKAVYNVAVENGAKDTFKALNIEVVATTDWGFDTGQLQRQLSSVLKLKPDIIMTGGTLSPEQAPTILEPAVKQGVHIGLLGAGANPAVWEAGKQYANFVSYPPYLLGETVAETIHEAYPDGAKVGMVYWSTDVAIVDQRDQGFLDGLAKYPNLELVAKEGMADPAKAGSVASAMLLKHKDLDVIYAPWDSPPGDAVAAAIRASSSKTKMVSLDIGNTGALGIQDGSVVLGESAEDVYDWGTTGALSTALHAIGESVPPFLVTPVYACTKDNLVECWEFMHGPGLPLPKP